MAQNKVIAGAYQGKMVGQTFGNAYLQTSFLKTVFLKDIVVNYEVLDSESKKSMSSALLRGGLGAALLGPVGLLAGLSAKNKNSKIIALKFNDGQECVVDVDDKIFKAILKSLAGIKSNFGDNTDNDKEQLEDNTNNSSQADEILKFKNLLDQGIISEEEFDAKKKQLLNL
jgi:conserved hypothetical protein